MKNDLRLVGLRGMLETNRFYKRPDSKKLPPFFAMGTVIEGAEEFFSGERSGSGGVILVLSACMCITISIQAVRQSKARCNLVRACCQPMTADQPFAASLIMPGPCRAVDQEGEAHFHH